MNKVICTLFFLLSVLKIQAQVFEMRYLTNDPKANGFTDFHGEKEWYDTDTRVALLNSYADYASAFWGDPKLNTPLFTDAEVSARVAGIKPQPTTKVRRTIDLNQWRAVGYKKSGAAEQEHKWKQWTGQGAAIKDGHLILDNCMAGPEIEPIDWRFSMKADMTDSSSDIAVKFTDDEGMDFIADVDKELGSFEIYGDLQYRRLFLSSGEETVREMQLPKNFGDSIISVTICPKDGVAEIDYVSLYGFVRDHEFDFAPYHTHLHYDEDFEELPSMDGWMNVTYDESAWNKVSLPSPHGGQNVEGEMYCLRTKVFVEDFTFASLEIESIDPAGDVWVNGEPVAVVKGAVPRSIDVSGYLVPGEENIISVRVKPKKLYRANLHSPSDHNVGWFLGRTKLILTDNKNHITEALTHTAALSDECALQKHRVTVKSEDSDYMKGTLILNYYPWFPEEGPCVATVEKEIGVRPCIENTYEIDLSLEAPELWSTSDPRLYRVEVILKDEEGNPIDDYVSTTGVRFIEQKEGVLYINNKSEMLNGGQNFGFRLPIEYMSKYVYCATDDMAMKDLMMVKLMGGNMLRMHIHADSGICEGVNDPRYAEYADQMGLYLIWQTPAWIREGEFWNIDVANYPLYMRQVYNHPSIVLWEAANHPHKVKDHGFEETDDYMTAIITAITQTDTSRLISPLSYWQFSHYDSYDGTIDYQGNQHAPNPLIMHRKLTRGSQDAYTGYGNDWSLLRNYPYPWAKKCLEARDLCYFNFEHEESAAQPNWELARKDPWYHVPSYEWKYEEGSIGRLLQFDEWRISQAFQAFSAWESMKLQTLSGVSGFSWCSMESGPNMFTYQKPLIDPYYVPKLAFHANTMVFQRIWAASDNVDVVYGPGDMISPVIFNLEEACTVDLTVELQNEKGRVIERKVFRNVEVPSGRSVTKLEPFRFRSDREGCHFIVYRLAKK